MPGTVTVACKYGPGIIMRLFQEIEVQELVLGGGVRVVKQWVPREDSPTVTVKGPGGAPFGIMPSYQVVGGYGLTPNVDADFFAEWMRQNAKLDLVVNKLIWAHEKTEFVTKFAKENKDRRSGLEPMKPATGQPGEVPDPRQPRMATRALSGITQYNGKEDA